MISEPQAHALLVEWMLGQRTARGSNYGYDLYLPAMVPPQTGWHNPTEIGGFTEEDVPVVAAAAWNFCRRGILRPGVRLANGQGVDDGLGYSITPLGKVWLAEVKKDRFIATEPAEVARLLSGYRNRFGDGFHERAQEAIKCYQGNAHLGCCAMCGAAAESILLTKACTRVEPRRVHAIYRSSQGRRKIEQMIFGSAPQNLKKQATSGLDLLTYWRDDASHGILSGISHDEAMTSIFLLYRFTVLMNDHWDIFTVSTPSS